MLDLQKASFWKRMIAYLFDGILLSVLVVGILFCLSKLTGYDAHLDGLTKAYAHYETQYGIDFEITGDEYNAMTEAERNQYDAAYNALISDREAMDHYAKVVNLTLSNMSLSILLSYMILEFVVPCYLGHGRTLGKKIFGLGVMRTDHVKINTPLLFIRTFLGKFTLETMIPVFLIIMIFFNMLGLLGTLIIAAFALLQIVLMIATSTNSVVHDLMAKTVVVDMSSQMVFDSEEALLAYKQQLQAQRAARQDY